MKEEVLAVASVGSERFVLSVKEGGCVGLNTCADLDTEAMMLKQYLSASPLLLHILGDASRTTLSALVGGIQSM